MYNFAILYHNDTGGNAKNLKQATQLAKKSANWGNVYWQNLLGWYYEYGNDYIPKNYTEPFKWLKAAADRGHTRAQYNLGMMYKNGWGVSSDYAKSQELFKSAAAEGDNDAAALYVKPVEVIQPEHIYKPNTYEPKRQGVLTFCWICNVTGKVVDRVVTGSQYETTHYKSCTRCGGAGRWMQ